MKVQTVYDANNKPYLAYTGKTSKGNVIAIDKALADLLSEQDREEMLKAEIQAAEVDGM